MRFLWFRCDEIIPGFLIGLLAIGLCLVGILLHMENNEVAQHKEKSCSIASEFGFNSHKFRMNKMNAFVLGYTGETGKVLVKELAKARVFQKVILIGRRTVELPEEARNDMFEQKQIDFDKMEEYADAFKDTHTGFCCLGTTRAKSGVKGFVTVDHDYVLTAAEVAKSVGLSHFSIVTSYGADPNSYNLYTQVKGKVEEALKVIHFERLSIFRPGVLLCDRTESRPMERIFRAILTPVSYVFPTAITTPVEVVAKAMINNAVAETTDHVELYNNKAIHQMSGTMRRCQKRHRSRESSADRESEKPAGEL